MRNLTTEQFIEKAVVVHGGLYDYSMVEYVDHKTKIKIICKRHNVFDQSPSNHLSGNGCMKCRIEKWSKNGVSSKVMMDRQKKYIEKCKKVHNNKYDYSKAEYKGVSYKINVICETHGIFEVNAGNHARGYGCNKCYFAKVRQEQSEKFLIEAKVKHGDKYDYSVSEYVNSKTKVKILCREHGIFETMPVNHVNGVGCPVCCGPKYRGFIENAKKTCLGKDVFIKKSREVHGDKYDYSKVVYKNNRDKVEIICPHHNSFFQDPSNHMKGVGCPGCKFEKTGKILAHHARNANEKRKKTFVEDMKKLHVGKWDYSETVYEKWDGEIKIGCPVHGFFYQKANNHSQGAGCPQCAPSGFDGTIPAILYYFEIDRGDEGFPLYKIGVTNRTVQERYALERDRRKIKIIKVWEYPLGYEARKMEQKIIRLHKDKIYQGEPPLDGVGIAEIFAEDILGLAI